MSKLTSKTRSSLPQSTFGLPGERKYPIPDKAHAVNAKARATQQYEKGNLNAAARAEIFAKANRKLGKGK